MRVVSVFVLFFLFSSYNYTQADCINEPFIELYEDWISDGNPDIVTRTVPEYIPDHSGIVNGLIINHKVEALSGVVVTIGEASDTTSIDGTFWLTTDPGEQELTCIRDGYEDFVTVINVLENDTNTFVIGLSPAFWPPRNLIATVNPPYPNIVLQWDEPVPPTGEIVELIYDNDVSTDYYSYLGYSMCTQMSPESACQILQIKFHTSAGSEFNAEIWGWDNWPTEDLYYQELVTDVATDDWNIIDLSNENLITDGDFLVGFGSIHSNTYLSYDANLDNGRSWDHADTGGWTTWNETYLIRAVVMYDNGRVEELSPTSRELVGYNVYRNDELIGSPTSTLYIDYNVPFWYLNYYVTALYDDPAGESGPSNTVEIEFINAEDDDIPLTTNLLGNYPNPFNPSTNISFNIEHDSNVVLSICNMKGQIIKNLVNTILPKGIHNMSWNGTDENDVNVSSGIYFYKLQTDSTTETRKMLLLK